MEPAPLVWYIMFPDHTAPVYGPAIDAAAPPPCTMLLATVTFVAPNPLVRPACVILDELLTSVLKAISTRSGRSCAVNGSPLATSPSPLPMLIAGLQFSK